MCAYRLLVQSVNYTDVICTHNPPTLYYLEFPAMDKLQNPIPTPTLSWPTLIDPIYIYIYIYFIRSVYTYIYIYITLLIQYLYRLYIYIYAMTLNMCKSATHIYACTHSLSLSPPPLQVLYVAYTIQQICMHTYSDLVVSSDAICLHTTTTVSMWTFFLQYPCGTHGLSTRSTYNTYVNYRTQTQKWVTLPIETSLWGEVWKCWVTT
jgi:hypothetical protein